MAKKEYSEFGMETTDTSKATVEAINEKNREAEAAKNLSTGLLTEEEPGEETNAESWESQGVQVKDEYIEQVDTIRQEYNGLLWDPRNLGGMEIDGIVRRIIETGIKPTLAQTQELANILTTRIADNDNMLRHDAVQMGFRNTEDNGQKARKYYQHKLKQLKELVGVIPGFEF